MTSKILSTMLLGTFMTVGLNAESRIAERKENQQDRIAQGVKSGSLTPRETARIERKEVRLNREIRHDRADHGGKLTPAERRQVTRRQERLSRDIYRQKHDGQSLR